MNIMDTLIWLVNFPVSHAYAMVFIAGFSLMGLAGFAFRGVGGTSSRLTAVREREGLPEAGRTGGLCVAAARVQRLGFRVLAVIMLAGLVLGILALTGVPVSRGYIHDHGVPTTGTVDGDWVTFSTPGGETYTLESNFFSPALHPDSSAWLPSDAPVVVRYLPAHPQAFVIDTTQLPE
ncbi:hypothetical protein [Microbacterium murale]|uniref:Uncharacterized protein n=1 Tax=Microbacterium murale TaxID=1081040 RepID=A0ABU0PEP0_9MICO|nr:hypothetical protein [Microbacterium murale]MDQ0645796.1 hypothetical protein [Microbacterium murale]